MDTLCSRVGKIEGKLTAALLQVALACCVRWLQYMGACVSCRVASAWFGLAGFAAV